VSQESTNRTFDELASGLASGSISRGKALKLMGAALVGGTLASLGFGRVAAAEPPGSGCTRNGKPCNRDRQCCSGTCSSHGRCVGAPGAGPGPPECAVCECGNRPRGAPQNVCNRSHTVCVQLAQGEPTLRACMRVCGGSFPNALQFICYHIKTRCHEDCRGPA